MRATGAHVEMNESACKMVGGLMVERIAALLPGHERDRHRRYGPNENRKDGQHSCVRFGDIRCPKRCDYAPKVPFGACRAFLAKSSASRNRIEVCSDLWSICRVPALSLDRK